MLYRDKLRGAPDSFLNRPDSTTGVRPVFWAEFVDAILQPLPIALLGVTNLVARALAKKEKLSGKLLLPEIRQ